jgi:hypothetical protein
LRSKSKLSLAGHVAQVPEDIAELFPDAQQTTVFALVSARPRGSDGALEILDTLAREANTCLWLCLLRHAIPDGAGSTRAGLRGISQFRRISTRSARMWPERARQIEQTVGRFKSAWNERWSVIPGQTGPFGARPDDRIVMDDHPALTTP